MTARSAFLDRWEIDHKPRLTAIRDTALTHLHALEDLWENNAYHSKDTHALALYGADMSGTAYDLLVNLIAAQQEAADELELDYDSIDVDTLELATAADLWKARAAARIMALR